MKKKFFAKMAVSVFLLGVVLLFLSPYIPGTLRFDADGNASGTGSRYYYYATGQLKLRERYTNGRNVQSEWYKPNGDLITITRWRNGVGLGLFLHESGEMKAIQFSKGPTGLSEGIGIDFSDDGIPVGYRRFQRGREINRVVFDASAASEQGAVTGTGSLVFQLPSDWRVELHSPGVYTVTAHTPEEGLLLLSQWPSPGLPKDIPTLVQQLADDFLQEARKASDFKLASEEYTIEQFVGTQSQGSYAMFQISDDDTKSLQVIMMMNVSGRIWYGQFTGPLDSWKLALQVLQSVKYDG